ncbi:MAG TPA: hypothetical protein VLW85_03255 [Myxococcales bacterium]|nr:hypothetical protein [Myxococcales bacterium]
MHPWLQALRHDLVKRALWPARDLRDAGGRDSAALRRGLTQLTDAEGMPVTAQQLFAQMRREAPPGAACEPFAAALHDAVAQLDAPWPAPLRAVLALEDAFDALARSIPQER